MYLSRLLLAIWIFGLLGVAAELVLLEHYEDWKQLIPFVVIGIGLVAGAGFGARPTARTRMLFGGALVLHAITGLIGLVLHYRGNLEFEKERDPALGGARLVWEILTGATPALTPAAMILFAFIGYATIVASGTTPAQPRTEPRPP